MSKRTNLDPTGEGGTVVGLFKKQVDAERAINRLKAAGFSEKQIGVAIRDRGQQKELEEGTGAQAAEGAAAGALGGGVLGGVLGLLAGVGALAIPGIGPIVAGGALASTLAGAGIGAAAGGLIGALMGMGIPEEDARHFDQGYAYAFERTKHVVDVHTPEGKQLFTIDKRLPVHLIMDFNVDPITCLVAQFYKTEWLKVIDEYRLRNSDIFELLERIQTEYGEYYLVVTGDASGRNRDAHSKGSKSFVLLIKEGLKLSDRQIQFPSSNPSVKNTRMLLNALFVKHPKIYISSKCLWLIDDLLTVTTDEKGEIDKDKDKTKTHLLDNMRYLTWNYFRGYLNIKF